MHRLSRTKIGIGYSLGLIATFTIDASRQIIQYTYGWGERCAINVLFAIARSIILMDILKSKSNCELESYYCVDDGSSHIHHHAVQDA